MNEKDFFTNFEITKADIEAARDMIFEAVAKQPRLPFTDMKRAVMRFGYWMNPEKAAIIDSFIRQGMI